VTEPQGPLTPPEPIPPTGAPVPTSAFAPPSGPPLGSIPPPGAALPGPVPLVMGPLYTPPPAAPWSAGRRGILVAGIVAASLGIVGLLGGGIYALVVGVIDVVEDQTSDLAIPDIQPLIEGEPGSPVAVAPIECPDRCFTGADVGSTILDDSAYLEIGLPDNQEPFGTYENSSPQKEFAVTSADWRTREGTPESCFVTYLSSPVARPLADSPGVTDDTIHFTGGHTNADEYSWLYESVRVFSSGAAAAEHMATLDGLLAGCDGYQIGSGEDYWSAKVTRAPALEVPDSVAAVGWVEDSGFARYYSHDLQRGNLVVRVAVTSDGEISEAQFREFAAQVALQLESIEP